MKNNKYYNIIINKITTTTYIIIIYMFELSINILYIDDY